jgi:signal transduction histidine kinase
MSFPKSIRWRLPLSYAAIALLSVSTLGLILLLSLRSYYLDQERRYSLSAAEEISSKMEPFFEQGLPQAAFVSQVKGYAFLTQARVRILDGQNRLLADSQESALGAPDATISVQVEVGGVSQVISQTLAGGDQNIHYRSVIVVDSGDRYTRLEVNEQVSGTGDAVISGFPLATPFGWLAGADGPRSRQVALSPIQPPFSSQPVGYVEVSEGPAYGQTIVQRVAWGWALASLLATLTGAAAGWRISRRISQPLVELTAVTERMLQGDLGARTALDRPDELGVLAGAFNRMAERIEQTVQSLRRFVSDAAHELQTPLTVLHSDLDLMRAAGERVERARAQVTRLEAITSGLLDLSRIEGIEGVHTPVSLNRLVQQASELYASRAEQAGLAFSLHLPDDDLQVAGHETQLHLVVENLLENALKFNRAGRSVQVDLQRQAGEALLIVRDEGIGIPAGDLAHIPGRFHRAANAGEIPGSGLGLAIVSAVVEQHAGSLVIESGQAGTRVMVRLPLRRVAEKQ